MAPTLPRDEQDLDARQRQLERARDRYEWSYTHPPGIAKAKRVPLFDLYSASYLSLVVRLDVAVANNHRACGIADVFDEDESALLDGDEDTLLERIVSAPHELLERVFHRARSRRSGRRFQSLDEYYEFFRVLDPPAIATLWREGPAQRELGFAWQRLAGANPMVVRRISEFPDHFPVDDELVGKVLPGDSLRRACAEGRAYLADYAALDGLSAGLGLNGQPKYLWAPMALFVWVPGQNPGQREGAPGSLRPVAIQCGQRPGPNCPIWTPLDGWHWQMAMTTVQIADGNHHQAVAHLARTHLLSEAFAVACHRQLSKRHPLHVLLTPHFEWTLAINDTAAHNLMAPGGEVEVVLGGALHASLAAAKTSLEQFRLADALPTRELQLRGLDDRERLPLMPYRDEGLLVWAAIRDWVRAYLGLYYDGDMRVQTDPELQGWVRSLNAHDGARLPGIGTVDSFDALVDLVAFVIWTASAQHAAVNFTQYDFFGFVPNAPGAGFGPPPGPDTPNEEASWLAMLPPLGETVFQTDAVFQLANVRKNHLGEYGRRYFDDRAVRPLLADFQAALDRIEDGAEAREAGRLMPYPYLRPSNITASIHI